MWHRSRVAPEGTHHAVAGQPLYGRRFRAVLPFHEPGLAPVEDESGAYHITSDGSPAYDERFLRTFGFYGGLSAVVTPAGWHHIRPDGSPLYGERYAWTGNFQGDRCAVREFSGSYLHLDTGGEPVYPERYCYAGDYREGSAVVQRGDGLSIHIDAEGRRVHETAWLDLDVFHKGFARARDRRGWTHIDRAGRALYEDRYAMVEPFYNGQARVEGHDGRRLVIDEGGREVLELRRSASGLHRKAATSSTGIDPRLGGDPAGLLVRERYSVDVEQPLARSVNGALYRAWDQQLERPVLIRTRRGGAFAAREEHILRALEGLPGVPACYDAFDFGESRWMVMEPLPAKAVGSRFSCPPMPLAEILRCLEILLPVVGALHEAGFLHTDIQPTNVLREVPASSQGRIWLIDFELSVPIGTDGAWEGEIYWGLWDYAPPEQLAPISRLTPAADLYALGALAFALATGSPPFPVVRRNAPPGDWEALRRVCLSQRRVLPSLDIVPIPLRPLITKALSFDPTERHQSGSSMMEDIASCRARLHEMKESS